MRTCRLLVPAILVLVACGEPPVLDSGPPPEEAFDARPTSTVTSAPSTTTTVRAITTTVPSSQSEEDPGIGEFVLRDESPQVAVEPGETTEVPLAFEGAPQATVMLVLTSVDHVRAWVGEVELQPADFLGDTVLGAHLMEPADAPLVVSNNGSSPVRGAVMVRLDSQRILSVEADPVPAKPGETVHITITLTEPSPDDSLEVQIKDGEGNVVAKPLLDQVGAGVWETTFVPSTDDPTVVIGEIHLRFYEVAAWVTGPRPRYGFTGFAVQGIVGDDGPDDAP